MTKKQKDEIPGNIKYYDKNELIELLAYDIEKIENASLELRNDKDIGKIVLNEDPRLLGWLSSGLRDNADFLLENLKIQYNTFGWWGYYNDEFLRLISKRLRNDKEFVIKMIPLCPNLYSYISTSLRKDKEIYLITDAVCLNKASLDLKRDLDLNLKKITNGDNLYWVCKRLMSDKKFILGALEAGADPYWRHLKPLIRNDKEVVMKYLNDRDYDYYCTVAYWELPRNLKTDLDVLEIIIKSDSDFSYFIPENSFSKEAIPTLKKLGVPYLPLLKKSLLEDKNIVLDAIEHNKQNFWYSSDFRFDKDCLNLALRISRRDRHYSPYYPLLKGIKAKEIDRELALNFINIEPDIINYLPKRLFSDRNFILEAASICGVYIISFMDKSLAVDKEIMKACLKSPVPMHGSYSDIFKNHPPIYDSEILLEYVFKDPRLFGQLPERYRDDKPFIKKLLNTRVVQVRDHYWGGGGDILPFLSDRLKEDEEIMGLFTSSGNNIEYWPDSFKNNKKLLLKILKNSYWSYKFNLNVPNELKDNLSFMKEAVKISPRNFFYASERLRDNKSLLLLALEKKAHALKYASSRLKNNKEVVLKAFNRTPSSLKHSSKKLRSSKKFLKETVGSNPIDIFYNCHFTIRRQPEIYIPAMKEDPGCCERFSSNIILNLDLSDLKRNQQAEVYDIFEHKNLNADIFLLAHAKKKILKEPDRILCIEKKSGS